MVPTYLLIGAFALTASALPALADEATFPGPAGWSHVNSATPAADPTRKVDQWHIAGDTATTITYMKNDTTAYADALALIEKNFSDNKIKPATDKDLTCQGKTGHVVEFATGPDGHKIVINRMLLPDGPGVVSVTYSRSEGTPFDPEVQKAETAYCAAAGSS